MTKRSDTLLRNPNTYTIIVVVFFFFVFLSERDPIHAACTLSTGTIFY
jgi:hypothetical protein